MGCEIVKVLGWYIPPEGFNFAEVFAFDRCVCRELLFSLEGTCGLHLESLAQIIRKISPNSNLDLHMLDSELDCNDSVVLLVMIGHACAMSGYMVAHG